MRTRWPRSLRRFVADLRAPTVPVAAGVGVVAVLVLGCLASDGLETKWTSWLSEPHTAAMPTTCNAASYPPRRCLRVDPLLRSIRDAAANGHVNQAEAAGLRRRLRAAGVGSDRILDQVETATGDGRVTQPELKGLAHQVDRARARQRRRIQAPPTR